MRRKCPFKLNLKTNVFPLQEKVSLSDSPPTVESDLSSHLADTGDDTTSSPSPRARSRGVCAGVSQHFVCL